MRYAFADVGPALQGGSGRGHDGELMKRSTLTILIVEDSVHLAANLYDYLESCGHRADAAPDGVTGIHLASTRAYDAIVLDWNLPRLDGLTVLRRLRAGGGHRVPVIMLTARDQLADKIDGFESGVDDYLVKPVALPEIEVRLRALVARTRLAQVPDEQLVVADLRFDLRTLSATRGGRAIALSRSSRCLLELLMRESPRVVSRERLEQAIWDDDSPEADLLRSHIYLLRRAIEQDGAPRLLHTVPGAGYRLAAPE